MDNEIFKQMTETFYSPEIQGCLSAVESIIGYKLSAADKQPFLYFHNYITNPEPGFITDWRSDPRLEKWYHRLVNGFLGDVQNTIACVFYHHGRLKVIENAVIESIERFNYRKAIGNSCLGLGNTLVWDFEYQAFILAFRRCLDYLARAISAYFRNDFHSFRKLNYFLQKQSPDSITSPLISLHQKYGPLFEFVLSEGNRKSVRDKISHYEYVSVGTINLSQRGFMLAGGGEQLNAANTRGPVMLSEIIDSHIANLRACIREMIFGFVDSVQIGQSKLNV